MILRKISPNRQVPRQIHTQVIKLQVKESAVMIPATKAIEIQITGTQFPPVKNLKEKFPSTYIDLNLFDIYKDKIIPQDPFFLIGFIGPIHQLLGEDGCPKDK